MKNIFNASQFMSTKWDTAEQKARFANQFVKFVASDFKDTFFPDWFYKRLSMCFGHIAHYNQRGFYGTFFMDIPGKIRFLGITMRCACYGDTLYTYSDVERVLKAWVADTRVIDKYEIELVNEIEKRELAELDRLQIKYGGDKNEEA